MGNEVYEALSFSVFFCIFFFSYAVYPLLLSFQSYISHGARCMPHGEGSCLFYYFSSGGVEMF
jgi:hypothetical protein